VLFNKRDPKFALACKGAKTDSRVNFGKETIAGVYRRPNGFHIMVRRLTKGVLRLCSGSTQALLRLCSGLLRLAQALLRHAHPRLRYAYPQLWLKQQLLTSAD
jgi:hypothetical protein